MNGPKCGNVNSVVAKFCTNCGTSLLTQSSQNIKKTNAVGVFLLCSLLSAIYIPFWFLNRRDGINSLQSNEKIGKIGFYLIYVSMGLYFIFVILNSAGVRNDGLMVTILLSFLILGLIGILNIWVQSFKVRRILDYQFNHLMKRNIKFSGLLTFFFTVIYLQYKINRL